MERTTFKSMVLPWAQKWPLLLQTFSWLVLKHKFSVKALQNQQLGNATLMIFSHCGILVNLIYKHSSKEQTHITLLSNLRLKSRTLKLPFWTQLCTKASDSRINPSWTLKYTHFSSSHLPGVKKGFVKGETLRHLRTNSSKETFEENIRKFKSRLLARGYPKRLIETLLSDVKFTERTSALQQKNDNRKEIFPFVTQYQPAVPKLKHVLMEKWYLIQNQPSLQQIFKEPPIISFKKSKSLNDILVRAKI